MDLIVPPGVGAMVVLLVVVGCGMISASPRFSFPYNGMHMSILLVMVLSIGNIGVQTVADLCLRRYRPRLLMRCIVYNVPVVALAILFGADDVWSLQPSVQFRKRLRITLPPYATIVGQGGHTYTSDSYWIFRLSLPPQKIPELQRLLRVDEAEGGEDIEELRRMARRCPHLGFAFDGSQPIYVKETTNTMVWLVCGIDTSNAYVFFKWK